MNEHSRNILLYGVCVMITTRGCIPSTWNMYFKLLFIDFLLILTLNLQEVESPEEIIDNVPEAVSDPVAENEVITEPVPEVIDEVVGCAENHEQDEHEDRHEDDEPSVEPVDESPVDEPSVEPVDESPVEAVDEPKNIVDQCKSFIFIIIYTCERELTSKFWLINHI